MIEWQPIDQYPWPSSDCPNYFEDGPEVLLASPHSSGWSLRVGHGNQWRDTLNDDEGVERAFYAGEWRVEPTHFAFIQPPSR